MTSNFDRIFLLLPCNYTCHYQVLIFFIWIDGAHNYPVVAIDIANSIRMLSKNGVICIDDVYCSKKTGDKNIYQSIGAWKTLKAFEETGVINLSLVHKRINKPYAHKKIRKYIGIARLN